MEIVTVDKLGRIVIPKPLRKALALGPGTQLLAARAGGNLILKALDVKALAKQLHEELRGVDVERIASDIEEEANRDAAAYIQALPPRHQRSGVRIAQTSSRDAQPAAPGKSARRRNRRVGG